MRKIVSLFVCVVLLVLTVGCSQHNIEIVPEPVSLQPAAGHFTLDVHTSLVFQYVDGNDEVVKYIKDYFFRYFGMQLLAQHSEQNAIRFVLTEDEELGTEGYKLSVGRNAIVAEANTVAGWVYALQTLYQLAPPDVTTAKPETVNIPAVKIIDYPRFEWRGNMLDVSRHFFTVDYIKKHLDVLALYKINKFHWHLTDDHGWRIEIEKYPKLTEIGAWRPDRSGMAWSDVALPQAGEPATYGGYYTKAQVREIVAYAAQRNIEVIPEIEVPGHCAEVLAAYPHLACDDFPYTVQVGPYWPPKAILCGGNDAVLQFLKEVIDEVAVLFPSEYIHIGGDEALKENWKACRKCQQRIKDLHLQNEEVLQSWIIREVEKNIMAHGKKIIGWDEILDGGVAPGATVMYWRSWISDTLVVEAARRGNNIIMSPNRYCYFDYRQTSEDAVESEATNTLLPLTSVYAFDPLPEQLTNDTAAVRIKGGHANLWSELLYDVDKVEYMMLPRLLALSEGVWSPKAKKEWHNFEKKLPVQKQRLSALGYNYCEKYE